MIFFSFCFFIFHSFIFLILRAISNKEKEITNYFCWTKNQLLEKLNIYVKLPVADVAVDANSSSPVVDTNWLLETVDETVVGVVLLVIDSVPDITLPPELPSITAFLARDEERCLFK